MDKIKRMRAAERTAVDETISTLEVELTKPALSRVTLQATLQVLEKYVAKLTEMDEAVKEALLDAPSTTDEEYQVECGAIRAYVGRATLIKVRVEEALYPTSHSKSDALDEGTGSASSQNKRNFRLPKVELKKFSGELTEWLDWWSQFRKIDEDDELHETDKLHYLDQCMVKGTRAAELVSSFPHTAENYKKVVDALNRRFGNPKILKQVYVRELISMILATRNKEKLSLSTHYDRLESHLRSLESLGVTVEQMVVFLYPMVESSLPEEILVAWQRSNNFGKDGSQLVPPKSELDFLLDFLRLEIENEEQRKLARVGFSGSTDRKSQRKKEVSFEDEVPTAAGLFNGLTGCAFCDKSGHGAQECYRARKMTRDEKKEKLKAKGLCFFCLKGGHLSKRCTAQLKCSSCGRKHVNVMCPGEAGKSREVKGKTEAASTPTTQTNLNCTNEVVMRTLILRVLNPVNGNWKKVRVLLDCGSQRSYILKRTTEELKLKADRTIKFNHQVFGGGKIQDVVHQVFKVTLQSMNGGYSRRLTVMDQSQICGTVPRLTDCSVEAELKYRGIVVSDADCTNTNHIELLLGADVLGSMLTGKLVQLSSGLTATETKFGWCLMGQIRESKTDEWEQLGMTVLSMSVSSDSVTSLWKLETLGICDPVEVKSQEERNSLAHQHFLQTVTRSSEGRYSVCLPWIDTDLQIPSNRQVAEKRLESTTRKLNSVGKMGDYSDIFKSWEAEGIISRVTDKDSGSENCHYLPHRAVLKSESKTTPVRPVFDASCKAGRAPSLNDCLEKGPNLLELIPSILLRFRMKAIGVISDIRKAFLMIELQPQDRDSVRFLWWEDEENKKMITYRHNRVVFGMNCSPFLLGAVIDHHLSQAELEHPSIVQLLRASLYVDNCVLSVDSRKDYLEFKLLSTQILADAKMELRQWEYTRDGSSDNVSNVLGLKWDKCTDSLFCAPLVCEIPSMITKRVMLSIVQQVFDPLGFLSPVLLLPKLLLQRSWSENRQWEDEVTTEDRNQFQKWWSELQPLLKTFRVPRKCTGLSDHDGITQLHVFSDASKDAYAAAVFLRTETVHGVSVQLIQSKARVAPLKTSTIPRLELLGCVIAARLTRSVQKALAMDMVPVTFWTDSTTALSWIRRSDDWGTFVGNRVREIVRLTNVVDWKHVPGTLNPADLPSRGSSPEKFLELKWWEGPSWLKLNEENWPSYDPRADEKEVSSEKKRRTVAMSVQSQVTPWYIRKGTYIGNLRVMALVFRFITKLKKMESGSGRYPSEGEVTATELKLWKLVQLESFPKDKEAVSGLKVIMGEDGLLRVKTKLLHRQDSMQFKLPVALPNSHPLVDLQIRDEHIYNCHAGAQFVTCSLREKVWVLQGRRAVKRIIQKCVTCKRFTSKRAETPGVSLPEDRVKDASAFEITGIDLAGPLLLKNKSKVWIVLFTCAVYRCIHLELVESLSTEDFLLALIRFCKRKARPEIIYTDNGTNFVGADNLLKKLDWREIEGRTKQHRIVWKFNPPAAPWWGGWWERLIRSIKDMMKRMMGFGKLSYVQLETCLCEVEAAMNHRPLTFVTEDSEDLRPLTPAMFMYVFPMGEVPEARTLTVETLNGKKKRLEQLLLELKQRFRKEYLGLLVQRVDKKQHKDLKVGDIVLVGREDVKRILWPMGRIVELIPGKDEVNRVAKIKVKGGIVTRPVQRLYPLELSSEVSVKTTEGVEVPNPERAEESRAPNAESVEIHKTRSGREVRRPAKFSD